MLLPTLTNYHKFADSAKYPMLWTTITIYDANYCQCGKDHHISNSTPNPGGENFIPTEIPAI